MRGSRETEAEDFESGIHSASIRREDVSWSLDGRGSGNKRLEVDEDHPVDLPEGVEY